MKVSTPLFAGTRTVVDMPSGPTHQFLRDLHDYWLSKKGSRIAPPRSAIAPEEIAVALLPNIALLDVIDEPPRFRIRLFGTGLVEAFGEDVTGKYLDEIDIGSIALEVCARFTEVVHKCCPQTVSVHLSKQTKSRYLEYERIALPLSQDGMRVNMILCGFAVIRMWH
jgi:hypothetical protein